ncbi:hypothetical protein BDV06DRAFT_214871 [Aspergillus oleicola]
MGCCLFSAQACTFGSSFAKSLSDAGVRAAHLSLINLIPMYISGGYEFGAYLLGVSLETYGAIHRADGAMAVMQGIIHILIIARTYKISTSNSSHVYGILVASIFLSLILIPMIKSELLYAIWRHTNTLTNRYINLYLLCCLVVFLTTCMKSMELWIKFQGENIFRVILSPPRPWIIRAGQWINLNVPHAGLFYLFQIHPFTITYRVWINSPYSPTTVAPGRTSGTMGDYGHILMVATGIGIATQLLYIKELLKGHCKRNIQTRWISIIWQLNKEGDWEVDPRRFGYHDLIKVYSRTPLWEKQLLPEVDRQNGRMLVTSIL